MKNGDTETQAIARSLREPVRRPEMRAFRDTEVYRAVLVRLRFSSMCNEHVIRNYERAFDFSDGRHLRDVRVLWAFVDTHQYGMLANIGISSFLIPWEQRMVAADEFSQSGRFDFVLDLFKSYQQHRSLIWLVKSLVQRKASNAYVQAVLDNLRFKKREWSLDHCCGAPLEVLQRLAFETSLSPKKVQKMLSMVREKHYFHGRVSRTMHMIHILVFWEVSEAVLGYFLDRIRGKQIIPTELLDILENSSKYSVSFVNKHIERFTPWCSRDYFYNP